MQLAVHDGGVFRRQKRSPQRFARVVAALVGLMPLALIGGCEPKLVVGKWSCSGLDEGAGGEAGSGVVRDPLLTPWSTGFENGFCDYSGPTGYCYAHPRASYTLVTSPVHSGKFAAAYTIVADAQFDGNQTRCVRRGTLPPAAYYSAFFFVPSAPSSSVNWNLMHFRTGDETGIEAYWDVSLNREDDGTLRVFVYDFLGPGVRATSGVPPVPLDSWFKLELFIRRAVDATGELALYQDGVLALELTDVVTAGGDLGEWYVGNLAVSLTPPESTIYVDDVAIREVP